MKVNAFLGLMPSLGLIPKFYEFQAMHGLPNLKWIPWYKLHLTLFFWPTLPFADFIEIYNLIQQSQGHLPQKAISQIQGFDYFSKASVLYLRESSEEIFKLQEIIEKKIIINLPTHLQPQKNKSFIPHWTIARKFTPNSIQHNRHYFESLDSFNHNGNLNYLCFFRTLKDRYSPKLVKRFA